MIYGASAPGKVILLGEHSVVYGKPAVAMAIDRRVNVTIGDANETTLNGTVISDGYHPHLDCILERYGNPKLSIRTGADIPTSSGLGSSASFCSSMICAIRTKVGESIDPLTIANETFETEYRAQGRASPIDAYTATLGGGIVLNGPESIGKRVATVEKNGNVWNVNSIDVPEMTLVVGYTGIKANTGPIVEKVRRFTSRNGFAKEIIDEISTVTEDGIKAISRKDLAKLGELMHRDHKLLSILGVSCPELNKLVDATMKYSYGAKLTGSGGGGSMIALTDEPNKVAEAIVLHGGFPFIIRTCQTGVGVE